MSRELLQQTLDALAISIDCRPIGTETMTEAREAKVRNAITALRAALSEPEPDDDVSCPTCGEDGGTSCGMPNCGLLYTPSPASVPPYVPLTDEQIEAIVANTPDGSAIFDFARAVLAAQPAVAEPLTLEQRAMLHDAAHIINRAARKKGDHWDRVGSLLTSLADGIGIKGSDHHG